MNPPRTTRARPRRRPRHRRRIGSVPGRDWLKELPKLVHAITKGEFDVRAKALPLKDVEQAWSADTGDRIVLVP
ncbi:hypothetical protein AB0F46_31745 [Streptomyces sp. NPDC026665]|uniref:hypothetical protein n=1 Tax=Streptomyces sp. NPDC026665 TaxID=3154798 RepID=UPI0034062076